MLATDIVASPRNTPAPSARHWGTSPITSPAGLPQVLLALAFLLPSPAAAQCTPTTLGRLGGGATAVFPCGSSRAIVGMGTRVDLVTTPDTGVPVLVASDELGEPIKRIMGIGSTAWVSTPNSIYCFSRLTSASNPLFRESVIHPTDGVDGFWLVFPYVYSWKDNAVTVHDFTAPAAPSQVATFTLPSNPSDVAFSNERLYFTGSGITVVNIANRAAPAIIRTLPGTPSQRPITASVLGATGARLIYRDGLDADFRVCDVASDAAAPLQRGRFDIAPGLGIPYNFAGNMLVCEYGLIEVNASNPDAPSDSVRYTDFTSEFLGGASITSGGTTRFLLAGQWTGMSMVTGSPLIMHTTHRSPPSHAIRLAASSPLPTTADIFIADGYANALRMARFVPSASTPLTTIGGVDLGPAGNVFAASFDIAKEETSAYVTMGNAGLQSWNVSNAFAPTLRGTYLPSGDAIYQVAASGTTIACVRFSHILNDYAIDLVDWTGNTPQFRDSRPLPTLDPFDQPRRIAMHNGIIYVLFRDRIARYSFTPTTLETRATRVFGTELADIVFAPNDIAYALDSAYGVFVLNTSNVNQLSVLRGERDGGAAFSRGITLAHPWLVTVGDRLTFYRIDDPLFPKFVSQANLDCPGSDIISAGLPGAPRFVMANGTCGIVAIDPPADFEPRVIQPPQPVNTCIGGTAVYTVGILTSGNPANPVTFQWQRYINNFATNIPAATQQTLTLTNVSAEDAFWGYRCVISNICGNARTGAASLDLCAADFDDGSGSGQCDGGVTIDDLLYYLVLFDSGDSRCDIDDGSGTGLRDGGVTIDDLLFYLARFDAGC